MGLYEKSCTGLVMFCRYVEKLLIQYNFDRKNKFFIVQLLGEILSKQCKICRFVRDYLIFSILINEQFPSGLPDCMSFRINS